MNTVLSLLIFAGATVLIAAVAVAWWEMWRRNAAQRRAAAWSETPGVTGPVSSAATVDIHLDQPDGRLTGDVELNDNEREQSTRQAVLAQTLGRMADPLIEPAQSNAWADTQTLESVAASGSDQSVRHIAGK